jgi:hypothetical protein
MSITTTRLKSSQIKQGCSKTVECSTDTGREPSYQVPLTVSAIIKTLLEIINIKKSQSMDEETRKQFPVIAKEIILLAEQTQ